MGFNTSILLRNADLDRIAADTRFGERLVMLARTASDIDWARRGEGRDEAGNIELQLSIRDVAQYARMPDLDPGYPIIGALPLHSNETAIHVIEDGRMRSLRAQHEGKIPDEMLRALAHAMSHRNFEVRSADKVYRAAPPDWLGEDQWMSSWTRDALNAGSTFLVFANDALDQIEKDGALGARLARKIETYRHERQSVMRGREAKTPLPDAIRYSDFLASGCHANAILRFIPLAAGRRELIVSGQNHATVLRPDGDDLLDGRNDYAPVRRLLVRNGCEVRDPSVDETPSGP